LHAALGVAGSGCPTRPLACYSANRHTRRFIRKKMAREWNVRFAENVQGKIFARLVCPGITVSLLRRMSRRWVPLPASPGIGASSRSDVTSTMLANGVAADGRAGLRDLEFVDESTRGSGAQEGRRGRRCGCCRAGFVQLGCRHEGSRRGVLTKAFQVRTGGRPRRKPRVLAATARPRVHPLVAGI